MGAVLDKTGASTRIPTLSHDRSARESGAIRSMAAATRLIVDIISESHNNRSIALISRFDTWDTVSKCLVQTAF